MFTSVHLKSLTLTFMECKTETKQKWRWHAFISKPYRQKKASKEYPQPYVNKTTYHVLVSQTGSYAKLSNIKIGTHIMNGIYSSKIVTFNFPSFSETWSTTFLMDECVAALFFSSALIIDSTYHKHFLQTPALLSWDRGPIFWLLSEYNPSFLN